MWHVYDKVRANQENVVHLLGHFWTVHSLLQKKRGCMPLGALATVSYSAKILIKMVGFTKAAGGALNSCRSQSVRRSMVESIS
ncbi:hypothetical protein MPL3356_220035 [Mesorhizobium plurifarium]|uniref:Uncharacterized protein n=1 Tax=Mesorhizobium plurifarium TaxID=69974 RepID=A0A090FBA6_MESPL|nr:hypothetical protein MPL3356_220035 [Mesorhizobium plurifarium]